MRPKFLPPTVIFLGLLMASCSDDPMQPKAPAPAPPPSQTVDQFVSQAGLPNLHASYQDFVQDSIEVFHATYGPPHDCPSGCFYSFAWGLRLANQIGWIQIQDAGAGFRPDTTQYFDVAPADAPLSDSALWARMRTGDHSGSWFWGMVLPLLAADPDTPRPALLRLAHMLYSYISPYAAERLLDNPFVQTDREILTLLANLPVFQGDAYEYVRNLAREYLSRLQPGISEIYR